MFDSGINQLLGAISDLESLSAHEIRELLTGAFLDVIGLRDVKGSIDPEFHLESVRRLATALELHAVFDDGFDTPEGRASAFVAAEALDLAKDLEGLLDDPDSAQVGPISPEIYAAMEAGILYLIAGFDANAAVAARSIDAKEIRDSDLAEADAAARAGWSIRRLLELRPPPQEPVDEPSVELSLPSAIRWEIFGRIASLVDAQLRWLIRGEEWKGKSPADELQQLAERIVDASRYQEEAHLARLLAEACAAIQRRGLRSIPSNDNEIWEEYVNRRSRRRPLLWPAAFEYAQTVLQNKAEHAVVSVPTGAGKSSVAELAIASALAEGWVLYMTPTNALAAQVTRDLSQQFGEIGDIEVKGYLGGAEYTELPGESIEDVQHSQILVMTPEKCSLALRQEPDVFKELALVVSDECHLIGERGARGVIAELTLTEVLHRARHAKALLLSALVANAAELAAWLEKATTRKAQVIDDPWRPTRTLRALLCIDPDRANEQFAAAKEIVEAPGRKKKSFEASVSLLASYQGAWDSDEPNDYGLIKTELSVPLLAVKKSNGVITVDPGSYVNQAAGRITTELVRAEQRVLTFLPANKHYSFSVAGKMPSLGAEPRSALVEQEVEALLSLAEYELGVPSVLRELLEKGIAVHTAAMLRDEQRASEVAFADGLAKAMFATGTLAQGLNLPATAVVIGGTRVGDDRGMSKAVKEEATRSQLLNALGRVGRAYVASRSIGIVIPDQWVAVRPGEPPDEPLGRAPFLAYPDASIEVRSRIQPLIRTALDDPVFQIGQLTSEEEAAFTFLSGDDREDSSNVLRKSYGAYREDLSAQSAQQVSETLGYAGQVFVDEISAPNWIVEASYRAGIALPVVGEMYQAVRDALEQQQPRSIPEWRVVLTSCVGRLPWRMTASLLPHDTFSSTRMERLVESDDAEDATTSAEAVGALDASLKAWMSGAPLTELASPALGKEPGAPGRASGNAVPKLIALTEHGFGFGIARIAGGLAALIAVGSDEGDEEFTGLDSDIRQALDLLPIAIRFGCDSQASAAWYRWGFRRRRIAHLLADVVPPPSGLLGEELTHWVLTERRQILEGKHANVFDPDGVSLMEALANAEL